MRSTDGVAGETAAQVHATPALAEAERLMTICNSCRYCEGLCAVFPAMEMRRAFADGDLRYLANLCHGCGACYHDCQFSPPHEFAVNVPQALADVREASYAHYAWPRSMAAAFDRSRILAAAAIALGLGGFIGAFVAIHDPAALFGIHVGPGAFYRLIPHNLMVAIFGAPFLFAAFALALSVRGFWRDSEGLTPRRGDAVSLVGAVGDMLSLRHLGGGGAGCMNADERPNDWRRLFHHLTFYGFMLCLASTSVATLYHYLLGREAPYGWLELPVLLGVVGGIGLVIGPIGLLRARAARAPELGTASGRDLGTAFTAMLLFVSVTGLLLLLLRETRAMGLLLAIHLGSVLGLFVTLPYGKFVHGIYRSAALLRYAQERRAAMRSESPTDRGGASQSPSRIAPGPKSTEE